MGVGLSGQIRKQQKRCIYIVVPIDVQEKITRLVDFMVTKSGADTKRASKHPGEWHL